MLKVQNNVMGSRYELFDGGKVVLTLRYRMEHGQMWLLSMEDTATLMSQKNLDAFLGEVFKDVHRHRLETLPFCPTVREFMVRNPAYLQLLPKVTPGHFPDLHQAAALHQQRKKTLRPAVPKQKATTPKPVHGSVANPPSTPVPVPAPDQNDLNLAS